MRTLVRFFFLPCAAALMLSCGSGEDFQDATLSEAMSGAIQSKTNAYRIATPQVDAVKGDHALLREGRSVHILAGDQFETLWQELEGNDFTLLVKKWANPYPHLRLLGYEMNGEEHLTDWVLAESELPLIIDHQLYDITFFEVVAVDEWGETVPRELVDGKIWTRAAVTSEVVEAEELEEMEAEADTAAVEDAAPEDMEEPLEEDEAPVEGEETEEDTTLVLQRVELADEERIHHRFTVAFGDFRFDVQPIGESSVELLLLGLEAGEKDFGIGGYITEIYPRRTAAETGSAGGFRIEVFDFGGKYVLLR